MTNHQKLLEIINSIKENKGQKPIDAVSDDFDLRTDLGFDSLDLAEMTVKIEKEFGVDVFKQGLISKMGEIKSKIPDSR